MPLPKKDFDKADEGTQPDEPFAGFEMKRRADAPIFPTPARKDKQDNPRRGSSRITGAQMINGQWHDAEGVLLSPEESRQAHQAADAAAAEARRLALLGRSE